eukprot:CAMPEP_0173436124 /NCGR_PEP_ID=MMETSP1357-20121228/15771_1 /TAXON_ID=77926 /ORGANISM="Hemiselmis rufescens, Strain PCC563" /LENGTH=372 /DNA_ID=CAMNT_0014401179 /DNA_START=38 /DNA_END=1152 /DNA_ORIENTATION=+
MASAEEPERNADAAAASGFKPNLPLQESLSLQGKKRLGMTASARRPRRGSWSGGGQNLPLADLSPLMEQAGSRPSSPERRLDRKRRPSLAGMSASQLSSFSRTFESSDQSEHGFRSRAKAGEQFLTAWGLHGAAADFVDALCSGLVAARAIEDPVERARMRFREAVHIVIHIERVRKGEDQEFTSADKLYEAIRALIAIKRVERRSLVRRGLEDAGEAVVNAVIEGVNAIKGLPLSEGEIQRLRKEFEAIDAKGLGVITQQQLEKLAFRRTYHARRMEHRKAEEQKNSWVDSEKKKKEAWSLPTKQTQIDRNTAQTTAAIAFKELGSPIMDFDGFCKWHRRFARGAMGNISPKREIRNRRVSSPDVRWGGEG